MTPRPCTGPRCPKTNGHKVSAQASCQLTLRTQAICELEWSNMFSHISPSHPNASLLSSAQVKMPQSTCYCKTKCADFRSIIRILLATSSSRCCYCSNHDTGTMRILAALFLLCTTTAMAKTTSIAPTYCYCHCYIAAAAAVAATTTAAAGTTTTTAANNVLTSASMF